MYDELVKELREAEKHAKRFNQNPYRYVPYYGKAADAIEELQQRVPKRPHGRLIDADEFFKDICNSLNEMTAIGIAVDGEWLWGKLNDALRNAPTIIPAEECMASDEIKREKSFGHRL